MKLSIAIKSCHKFAERRKAQLDTWLKDVDCDFFFLIGDQKPSEQDVLWCDGASDAFQNIAPKVKTACLYALGENVTNLLVCDDDTFIRWAEMMTSGFHKFDYVGHLRTDDIAYNLHVPYAQGAAYWLTDRSMEHIVRDVHNKMRNGIIDDGAVGQCLDGKVPLNHDRRYWPGPYLPQPDIAAGSKLVSLHKCTPAEMHAIRNSDVVKRG